MISNFDRMIDISQSRIVLESREVITVRKPNRLKPGSNTT